MKLLLLLALLVAGYLYWKGKFAPRTMARGNAAKLLGVAPDAGTEAVLEAHRRLIAKVHPDAGGSAELAAQINLARDAMLRK